MAQTTFSLEYILSLIIVLVVSGIIQKSAPKTSTIIKIIIGLLTAYVSLFIFNLVLPRLNNVGSTVYNYSMNSMYGSINNTGYMQLYPPLFAVLIIFLILLYSGGI